MSRAKSLKLISVASVLSAFLSGCGIEPAEETSESEQASVAVDEQDEATLQSALAQSATADSASLEGKLFGYVFGDGNYHPHKSPPRNAEFQAPLQVLARDFVLAACKLGDSGKAASALGKVGGIRKPALKKQCKAMGVSI